MSSEGTFSRRREGDEVQIAGDYQARALSDGMVVQRFWHTLKIRLVDRILPVSGARVLDVGSGSGVVANRIAAVAERVDGVDNNPDAIAFARRSAVSPNVYFHQALIEEIDFADETFDCICCLELIEHLFVEQGESLFRALRRLLKPGGLLLASTPNYASAWPIIELFMDAFRLAPRLRGEQHVSRYNRRRLSALGSAANLHEVEIGRFCGVAPFASIVSWRFGEMVDGLEERLGSPFGNLLYGLWERPRTD